MAKDYKKKVEEAKKEVEEARYQVIDVYLNQLRELYIKGDDKTRNFVEGELEKMIRIIETRSPNIFDPKKAREIRINLKLTQTELARQLNLSQAMLSQFEKGLTFSSNPRGEKIIAYLNWLKEQGYNPYD